MPDYRGGDRIKRTDSGQKNILGRIHPCHRLQGARTPLCLVKDSSKELLPNTWARSVDIWFSIQLKHHSFRMENHHWAAVIVASLLFSFGFGLQKLHHTAIIK